MSSKRKNDDQRSEISIEVGTVPSQMTSLVLEFMEKSGHDISGLKSYIDTPSIEHREILSQISDRFPTEKHDKKKTRK